MMWWTSRVTFRALGFSVAERNHFTSWEVYIVLPCLKRLALLEQGYAGPSVLG